MCNQIHWIMCNTQNSAKIKYSRVLMCVIWEITSERHQTNYDFDLVIRRASETIVGVSRWLFSSTDHSLKHLRCVILRGDFKTTADRLICEQTFMYKPKTHSKGTNQDLLFLSPSNYLHLYWQLLASKSVGAYWSFG